MLMLKNYKSLFTILTILFVALFSCAGVVFAEELDKEKVSDAAYKAYQVGNYERARELYTSIDEVMPAPRPKLDYNQGAVNYRMGEFEEAAKLFESATASQDPVVVQNAHFNLGNTHFQSEQYDKAVESYKETLKLNPTHSDAKYNLELALRKLQEQEKQEQDSEDGEDQEENQDQEKEEQDKEGDQEDQDQQKKEQDKQEDEKKNQEQNPKPDSTQSKDQQEQQQQPQPQQMSKEDAERLLNSLKDEEMKQQLRKYLTSAYRYTGKKW